MKQRRWPALRILMLPILVLVLSVNLGLTGYLWLQQEDDPDLTTVVGLTQSAVVSVLRETDQGAASDDRAGDGTPVAGTRSARDGDDAFFRSPSLGAGVIVDPDGLIVTNFHVIEDLSVISVRLFDDRVLTAEVVGIDRRTDLALLRVDADGPLPSLELADSDTVSPGQVVLAIGDPLGYEGSVTMGIVSGARRAYDDVDPVDFIQHDAAINPGNSGGPIVDLGGRLVGLNTAIPDTSPFDIGIGLAIPSNLLAAVVADLAAFGEVARPWAGVYVEQLDPSLAEAIGRPVRSGLVVTHVVDGSPAAEAGLQPGDIVTAVDGAPVRLIRDLARAMDRTAIGAAVEVALVRGGDARTTTLTSAAIPRTETEPGSPTPEAAIEASDADDREIALGFLLDGDVRARSRGATASDQPDDGDVRIGAVDPDGIARRAGLVPGDRILAVGSQRVESPDHAARLLGQVRGPTVALLIQRGDGLPSFVVLPVRRSAEDRIPVGNLSGLTGGPY